MTKRKFGINTDEMTTEVPLLDAGLYTATIYKAGVIGRDNKQFLTIGKEMVKPKGASEKEWTGEWTIQGGFMYQVVITSKRAIKRLGQDEPKLSGWIAPKFNPDGSMDNCPALMQVFKVFDIDAKEFQQEIMEDYDYDEDIKVPTELESCEYAVELCNYLELYREYFAELGRRINNEDIQVSVVKEPHYKNKSVMVNNIPTDWGNFCGFIEIGDATPDDLED